MEDGDEDPSSRTSEIKISELVPLDHSKLDDRPHESPMENPLTSVKPSPGATDAHRLDAANEWIESNRTGMTWKGATEQELSEQSEVGDFPDPQERGIIGSLYSAISNNFKALLKRAKVSISQQGHDTSDESVVVAKDQTSTDLPSPFIPAKLSQVESLQRDFMRFHLWGKEFDAAGGKLDERLEFSAELKEDLILVLLHLCDALYQGMQKGITLWLNTFAD